MANYSRLSGGGVSFASMMQHFGVVTVMNAKVYEVAYDGQSQTKTLSQILATYNAATPLLTLKTLKIANVTFEGPTKTVTGGQTSNPLIKYGKTAKLEIQNALGNADALEFLGGALNEYSDSAMSQVVNMHFGDTFAGPKCIIGDSFFIDSESGKQVKVKLVFYRFLPDSISNLTQDAEGDASVFDLNGDLMSTPVKVDINTTTTQDMNDFYGICAEDTTVYFTTSGGGSEALTVTPADTYYVSVDGATATTTAQTIAVGAAGRVQITKSGVTYVDTILKNY